MQYVETASNDKLHDSQVLNHFLRRHSHTVVVAVGASEPISAIFKRSDFFVTVGGLLTNSNIFPSQYLWESTTKSGQSAFHQVFMSPPRSQLALQRSVRTNPPLGFKPPQQNHQVATAYRVNGMTTAQARTRRVALKIKRYFGKKKR